MEGIHIGCSGFNYRHWKGNFYPEHLSQHHWFSHYMKTFTTVELNVTFYRLVKAETFDKWYAETPENFIFAVKGSRYITHIKRLLEPAEALERFFESVRHLREKLGVVLWQFPPGYDLHLERLREFLGLLQGYGVRCAFEFRNEEWIRDDVVALLAEHGASLCMAEWPPFLDDLPLTGGFVYLRRHGHTGQPNGNFPDDYIARDAERIRGYRSRGYEIFMYYNNDAGGAAPANAQVLMSMLG